MARPVVSTSLGAEGLDATPEQHLLLANLPGDFGDAVLRILGDPDLANRLGHGGRELVAERYSWKGTAVTLETFFRETLANRRPAPGRQQLS